MMDTLLPTSRDRHAVSSETICAWQSVPVVSGELQSLLADDVTVHDGRVPKLFLPSGSVDLIFAAGRPLPAPWGPDSLLIQVHRTRGLHVAAGTASAIRVPLEIGVFSILFGRGDPADGLYAAPADLRAAFERGRESEFRYDHGAVLEIIQERFSFASSAAVRGLRQLRELLWVARSSAQIATVQNWSRGVGISPRVLERTLRAAGCPPPKALLRVLRLNRAIDAMAAGLALAHAGYVAGYADQSHMSRECRTMIGWTAVELRLRARSGEALGRRSASTGHSLRGETS